MNLPPNHHSPQGAATMQSPWVAWRAGTALALALTLAGCTSMREGTTPLLKPAARSAFEQHHLAQAKQQAAEGDLAQAAYHWEVLSVLRPGEADYAEGLAKTQDDIERAASAHLRAARQAQQKGAHDEAVQRYLAVLALQPDNQSAAQALRGLERERVWREQLGRYSSRMLVQPRIPVRKAPMPMPAASVPAKGQASPATPPDLTSTP